MNDDQDVILLQQYVDGMYEMARMLYDDFGASDPLLASHQQIAAWIEWEKMRASIDGDGAEVLAKKIEPIIELMMRSVT